MCSFFFFKQKTAYEMRISDWSSDVCSSDLDIRRHIEGDVVTARHANATYRTGVFLRRHRRGVAVATLVLVAAAASAALHVNNIAHERDLARIEAAKARQVTGLLVSMLESADPAQARGEEVSVREGLAQPSGERE